jgi:GNAT superfamily N-acetyltransferase
MLSDKAEKKILYRAILEGEEEEICLLVLDCFGEFVAPGYSEEGITEFSRYVTPKFTRYRLSNNHFMIIATDRDIKVGVIEVRNYDHISLFFVMKKYQNKGIGKKLHELAISKCLTIKPNVTKIEVHSSPYAVPVYEKLGFVKTSDEQVVEGMRFTPMVFNITSKYQN